MRTAIFAWLGWLAAAQAPAPAPAIDAEPATIEGGVSRRVAKGEVRFDLPKQRVLVADRQTALQRLADVVHGAPVAP
jgi:hypothetical protein